MPDFARRPAKTRKWLWQCLVAAPLAVSAFWGTTHLAQLQPAAPTLEGMVIYGTVTRGPMVREVSGRGPLVPVSVTIVTADIAGQVAEVFFQPGVALEKGTVLVRVTDPVVERNLVEAKRSLISAESERDRFKLLLEQQELDLRAQTAQARAAWEDAKGEAEMKGHLAELGLISTRENRLTRLRSERSWSLLELQLARVENSQKTNALQFKEKEAAVARANDVVADRTRDVESLQIRATKSGILQELGPNPVDRWEIGQRIPAGGRVAKITDPSKLKAIIDVSDVHAKEVIQGLLVVIDMRTAKVPGRVARVDPAVRDGKVAVEVELLGDLPPGARPELEVYGNIEIERLDDVLQLAPPPVIVGLGGTTGLFRVNPDGLSAERVAVQLGRAALHSVEVENGLQEKDRIIVSDMSGYDDANRVLLPRQ
jgi:HlyD family secretion protein